MSNLPTNRNETSRPKRSALPDPVVDALFRRLATMYGEKWLALWANLPMDEVKRAWGEELAECSRQMLEQAVGALDGPYPPTLPEFRALCRRFRPSTSTSNIELLRLPRQPVPASTFATIHQILASHRQPPESDE